jgi:hypothetical protein
MQNLQGLEFSDFETKGNIILGKVEVDKDGSRNFTELEGVTNFDIQSNITNLFLKTCAKTFMIEILNTFDKYSLFDKGKSKYDYIKQGRRIKLYIGINTGITVEDTFYTDHETEATINVELGEATEYMVCGDPEYGGEWWDKGYTTHVGRCCMGYPSETSIRLTNIQIPQGAIIDNTTLKIDILDASSCSGNNLSGSIIINAEKIADSAKITSLEDFKARVKTSAYTEESIPYPTAPGNYVIETDITAIIQEIVNQEDWESGNSINIFFSPAPDFTLGDFLVLDFTVPENTTLTTSYKTSNTVERTEQQDFHWSWVYGIIDNVSTSKSADGETCTITGRDYVAYLAENYLKNLWWGKQIKYNVVAEKEKYDMPSSCKGIYRAFLYNESTTGYDELTLNSEFTYDWKENQLVFIHPNVPFETKINGLYVYYFTPQKVENVVTDLLIEAGILTYSEKQSWLNNPDLVTPTGKYIDRIWFDSGTSYIDAIELLTERVIYRFGVTNSGKPFFKTIPVLLSKTVKRLNAGEYIVKNVEDRIDELYNHFYLVGEEREMKRINLSVFANGVEDITTDSVTEKSTAVLVGTVLADGKTSARQKELFGGTSIITQKGFKWQKAGEAEQVYSSASSSMGLFTKALSNLDPNSRYNWLVWAKNSLGHYAESNWNTFITPEVE